MHPHWHKYLWVMHDWCLVSNSLIKSTQVFTFRLRPFTSRSFRLSPGRDLSLACSSTSCKSPESLCLCHLSVCGRDVSFPTQCPCPPPLGRGKFCDGRPNEYLQMYECHIFNQMSSRWTDNPASSLLASRSYL